MGAGPTKDLPEIVATPRVGLVVVGSVGKIAPIGPWYPGVEHQLIHSHTISTVTLTVTLIIP